MIDSRSLHFVQTDNYRELLVRSYLNMVLREIFIGLGEICNVPAPRICKIF